MPKSSFSKLALANDVAAAAQDLKVAMAILSFELESSGGLKLKGRPAP